MKKRKLALAVLVYNLEKLAASIDLLLNLLFTHRRGVGYHFVAPSELEIASQA